MSAKKGLTRREFFKDAAIAGAVIATTGALPATRAEAYVAVPKKWHKEVDVLIVGYGGAGASAAILAADSGAKTLIIEKAPKGEEGGNTRVSGNLWFNPTPAGQSNYLYEGDGKGNGHT